MATVTINGTLELNGSLVDDIGLASNSSSTANLRVVPSIASAQAVTYVYSVVGTLTSATTDTIDITGGVSDAFGNTLTFDKIYALGIENNSATNDMTFTYRINAAADSALVIKPLGSAFWYAPMGSASTVSDISIVGTSDDTYDILIIGKP